MKTGSGNRSDRCTIAVISVSTTTPILIAMSTADCGAVEVLASILMLLSFPSSQAAPIPLCAFYALYAGTTLRGSTAGCFVTGEGRAAASCYSCPPGPRNPRTSAPLPVGRRPPLRPFAYPLGPRPRTRLGACPSSGSDPPQCSLRPPAPRSPLASREGGVELREQPLHPTPCARSEQLVNGGFYLSRVDALHHAPHHRLALLRHARSSSRRG